MYRSAAPSDLSNAAYAEQRLTEWLQARELAALLAPEAATVSFDTTSEYDDQTYYTGLGDVVFSDKDRNALYPYGVTGEAEAAWERIVKYRGEDPPTEDEDAYESILEWIEETNIFYDTFDYLAGGNTVDLTKAPPKPRELYIFADAA